MATADKKINLLGVIETEDALRLDRTCMLDGKKVVGFRNAEALVDLIPGGAEGNAAASHFVNGCGLGPAIGMLLRGCPEEITSLVLLVPVGQHVPWLDQLFPNRLLGMPGRSRHEMVAELRPMNRRKSITAQSVVFGTAAECATLEDVKAAPQPAETV